MQSLCFELARVFDVTVLAPHTRGAASAETIDHDGRSIDVRRFRYFIPGLESLAYEGGIMAKLKRNPLRLLLVPFFLLAQLFAVARLQRQSGFDVVHAHWLIPQGLIASLLGWVTDPAPPYVVTVHGSDLHMLGGGFMTRLKRRAAQGAAGVTVVSAAMRDKVGRLGASAENVVVRSMGVDLREEFTPGEGGNRDGLVFVGRLIDVKGLPVLIDAMQRLSRDRPNLRLTIIGDGPERRAIEQRSAALGLDGRVIFAGRMTPAEIVPRLRAAEVFVMPSVVTKAGAEEGFGLVAVEAMGCSCAVVASNLGGIRDAVRDNETGLLAAAGDAADLARKIALVLDDEALRMRLAGNARTYALEHYDWRVVGEDYARSLLTAIGRG